MKVSSWAAGWALFKGKIIEFDDSLLDVAVKLYSRLKGELQKKGSSFLLTLPYLPKEFEVNLDFVRGLLEAGGVLGEGALFVPKLKGFEDSLRELLFPFNPKETLEGFFFTGEGANLLVHSLYDCETEERSELYFEKFLKFIAGSSWERTFFNYSLEEGALPPFKKRISDSGFDLHLIKLLKREGNLYFFDTGVRVSPPPGYYFDLVPRSSIFKSGFILANSVGIIDMTYRGTIKVSLIKVNPDAKEPQLPWRAVQLIPRRFYPLEGRRVPSLEQTLRGEGGFGSTG
ncbi:dUTP diphosphatase [Thermovibrio sp.]